MKNKFFIVALVCVVMLITSCGTPSGDDPGSEYMPDMGHSIAYEANYYDYYYYNTWGTEDEYYQMAQPRKPVANTIPRGYAGVVHSGSAAQRKKTMEHLNGKGSNNTIAVPVNGFVPYYYEDTEEERTRATAEIVNNPYPITADGLERGKLLYDINCGICHGKKGDGNGYLVAEENPNAVYPAQPAILNNEEFTNASNGRMYHAIMYGKNVMGGYADKLSYEERWQVIHYIRSLQAKEWKKEYNEDDNTLNNIDVPGASMQVLAEEMHSDENHGAGHDNHSDAGHGADGHDHNGGDHSHDAEDGHSH